MLKYKEYLSEDFKDLQREPSSFAAKQAKEAGLEHYGFGRYGKDNKITHVVTSGKLSSIKPEDKKEGPNDRVIKHSKGLSNDKKLTTLKKKFPDAYKKLTSRAGEKEKMAQQQLKDEQAAYAAVDKANKEFDDFHTKKKDEAEKHHQTLTGKYDWRGLSPEEQDTLINVNHDEVNKAILDNPNKKHPAMKHLDSIMDKTMAPSEFHTYAPLSHDFDPSELYGKEGEEAEINMPTYRHTTLNMSIAQKQAMHPEKKEAHIMQFKVTKGQKGMYMDGNYTGAKVAGARSYILPRNTSFKLTGKPTKMVHPDGSITNIHMADIINIQPEKQRKP